MVRSLFFSFPLFALTMLGMHSTLAVSAQMQSGNYQIQSDSINVGGGFSSSTNFQQESTAGEIATGPSDSPSFSLNAGYQQMQEVYIALSGATDVSLSPAIGGVSGGESNGTTTVTVITDSSAGYQLTIAAENSPAMQSSLDTIADYAPVGAVPDFTFNYGAAEAVFAYTPEGVDVVSRFLDNGTDTCGGGGVTDTTSRCWDGLSTTATVIASSPDANHPAGTVTSIGFRVGIGGAAPKTEGVYYATTTVTALAL